MTPDPSTEALRVKEALELGLQAWRMTPVRDKFFAALDVVDALAAQLGQAEEVIKAAQKLSDAHHSRARDARFWTLNEREALSELRDSLAALVASSAGETDG